MCCVRDELTSAGERSRGRRRSCPCDPDRVRVMRALGVDRGATRAAKPLLAAVVGLPHPQLVVAGHDPECAGGRMRIWRCRRSAASLAPFTVAVAGRYERRRDLVSDGTAVAAAGQWQIDYCALNWLSRSRSLAIVARDRPQPRAYRAARGITGDHDEDAVLSQVALSAQSRSGPQAGHRPALENCGSQRSAPCFRGNAVIPADRVGDRRAEVTVGPAGGEQEVRGHVPGPHSLSFSCGHQTHDVVTCCVRKERWDGDRRDYPSITDAAVCLLGRRTVAARPL